MKDIQKELHDDFCILVVFLFFLAIGMIIGLFYVAGKEYSSVVRQGLDSYNHVVLK